MRWRDGAEGDKARAPRRSNSLEMAKRKAPSQRPERKVQTGAWQAEGRGHQGWDNREDEVSMKLSNYVP